MVAYDMNQVGRKHTRMERRDIIEMKLKEPCSESKEADLIIIVERGKNKNNGLRDMLTVLGNRERVDLKYELKWNL